MKNNDSNAYHSDLKWENTDAGSGIANYSEEATKNYIKLQEDTE